MGPEAHKLLHLDCLVVELLGDQNLLFLQKALVGTERLLDRVLGFVLGVLGQVDSSSLGHARHGQRVRLVPVDLLLGFSQLVPLLARCVEKVLHVHLLAVGLVLFEVLPPLLHEQQKGRQLALLGLLHGRLLLRKAVGRVVLGLLLQYLHWRF